MNTPNDVFRVGSRFYCCLQGVWFGAAWRTGYNPSTGTWAGQRGGYNAYGSWKQTAVTNGTDWARGDRVTPQGQAVPRQPTTP